jgi:hypothetical protein
VVRDPHHPVQIPPSRVITFTVRMIAVSAVLPGNVQHRTGTPSLVTAIAMTTCGRSARESLEQPGSPYPTTSEPSWPNFTAEGRTSSARREPHEPRSSGHVADRGTLGSRCRYSFTTRDRP